MANIKKELILTVGLPRSGKSTWAKEQDCPVVNPDSIRLAIHGQRYAADAEDYVWAVTYTMAKALFLSGHTRVIVDATNNTPARRERWLRKLHDTNICDSVYYKLFSTSEQECIRRAGNDDEMIYVIKRMSASANWNLSDYEQVRAEFING